MKKTKIWGGISSNLEIGDRVSVGLIDEFGGRAGIVEGEIVERGCYEDGGWWQRVQIPAQKYPVTGSGHMYRIKI